MTNLRLTQPAFNSLDSFLDGFFTDFSHQKNNHRFFPAVNILENEDAFEMELNVPGRKKEDFKITFDKNILSIAFENKEENTEENKKFIKKEFSRKSFKRSFSLDEKINSEAISAKYEDGILTLTLPKAEELKVLPKEISVS